MKLISCVVMVAWSSVSFAASPGAEQDACLEQVQARYAAALSAAGTRLQAELERCDAGGPANVADRCYLIAGRHLEAAERTAEALRAAEIAACTR